MPTIPQQPYWYLAGLVLLLVIMLVGLIWVNVWYIRDRRAQAARRALMTPEQLAADIEEEAAEEQNRMAW